MHMAQNGTGPGFDLASMLSRLLNGQGLDGLRSLMLAQQENSLVMRRHMLRAEAEILRGLMALVEEELKKVDREMEEAASQNPVGREKISVA